VWNDYCEAAVPSQSMVKPYLTFHNVFRVLVFFPALMTSGLTSAQWTSLGAPSAGSVSIIAWDPSGAPNVYAGYEGTLFKSVNGGQSWQPSGAFTNGEIFNDFAIRPDRPKSLLLATTTQDPEFPIGAIYHSTDAGATWSLSQGTYGEQYLYELAYDPITPQIAYAAGYAFYRSSDGGASFRAVSEFAQAPVLALDQGGKSVIVAGVQNSGLGYPGTPSKLARSFDHGTTWQLATLPKSISDDYIPVLAGDPQNSQTVYAVTYVGTGLKVVCHILKSTDGGSTWIKLPAQGAINAGNCLPTSLVVDPTNSAHLILSQNYGDGITPTVLSSVDGGSTWAAAEAGLQSNYVAKLAHSLKAASSPPFQLVAATPQGPFLSQDAGSHWSVENTGLQTATINKVVADPTHVGRIFAATQAGVFKLSASPLGANSWILASTGLGSLYVADIAIDLTVSPHVLYAATDAGLFTSIDLGASWQALPVANAYQNFSHVILDAGKSGTIYAINGADGGLYISHNFGASWVEWMTPRHTSGDPFVMGAYVDPFKAGVVYAWTAVGLYKSSDAGVSFTQLLSVYSPPLQYNGYLSTATSVAILKGHGNDRETLFFSTNGNTMLRSFDGGKTWSSALKVPYIVTQADELLADSASERLFIEAEGQILESRDRGASWTTLTGNLPGSSLLSGPWVSSNQVFVSVSSSGSVLSAKLGSIP
jgi:photosystem II stability/assembly factor-like uncharacterized protein